MINMSGNCEENRLQDKLYTAVIDQTIINSLTMERWKFWVTEQEGKRKN